MSFEHDELDGKYSLISCRTTCVLLCMMLSCLSQTLECCLHCMSLPVIGQGMPVFKRLAVNRWSLSATFRGGKFVFPSAEAGGEGRQSLHLNDDHFYARSLPDTGRKVEFPAIQDRAKFPVHFPTLFRHLS